jgi:hypothetical protein
LVELMISSVGVNRYLYLATVRIHVRYLRVSHFGNHDRRHCSRICTAHGTLQHGSRTEKRAEITVANSDMGVSAIANAKYGVE